MRYIPATDTICKGASTYAHLGQPHGPTFTSLALLPMLEKMLGMGRRALTVVRNFRASSVTLNSSPLNAMKGIALPPSSSSPSMGSRNKEVPVGWCQEGK